LLKIASWTSRHVSRTRSVALLAALLALTAGDTRSHAYEERAPEPTADYASLSAARDALGSMIERAVRETTGPKNQPVHLSRARVRFKYWYAGDSTDAWAYRIVVSDAAECPLMRLEYALDAAGWTAQNAYAADGPDGSAMGFVSKRFFCLLEGHWDGGDDSDSSYVPAPGCEVTVTVAPRRADDVPRE